MSIQTLKMEAKNRGIKPEFIRWFGGDLRRKDSWANAIEYAAPIEFVPEYEFVSFSEFLEVPEPIAEPAPEPETVTEPESYIKEQSNNAYKTEDYLMFFGAVGDNFSEYKWSAWVYSTGKVDICLDLGRYGSGQYYDWSNLPEVLKPFYIIVSDWIKENVNVSVALDFPSDAKV